MISFIVPIKPIAKERPRVTKRYGFARTYTPAKTANYEKLFRNYADQAMSKENLIPSNVPVKVSISFVFKKPKKPAYHVPTKSDLDNLLKSAMDAMNGICWIDDRLIFHIDADKRFDSDFEGTEVHIVKQSREKT